jgi:CheY-like chemotaxis protein
METAPIIIIDDDNDDCELVMDAFTDLKVKNDIIVFTNALKAFEYVINLKIAPFFILCDIDMPILNGLELRKKINENENARIMAIPFLFWSTLGKERFINEAYSLNIQGFFKKPNNLEEIRKMILIIMDYWNCSDHPVN